ncbi:MAG: hypothetical protein AAGA15_09500 [Pseudomonadota bacterium]
MAEAVTYPVAPARQRAMYFNLACYALVAVLSGGYWQAGAGWHWLLFALVGFVLFGFTLNTLTKRGFIARIEGTRVETQGPTGGLHAFDVSAISGAQLDPSARIGVISYRDAGDDTELFAPVSFRMMGREGTEDFIRRINELRPGIPPVRSPSKRH